MRRKFFIYAFIFALALSGAAFAEIISGPGVAVVEVEGGKLQGYISNNNNINIYTYQGVPYLGRY